MDEFEQILEDDVGAFIRHRIDFIVGTPKKGLKGR
jgi:hypothetical protein